MTDYPEEANLTREIVGKAREQLKKQIRAQIRNLAAGDLIKAGYFERAARDLDHLHMWFEHYERLNS